MTKNERGGLLAQEGEAALFSLRVPKDHGDTNSVVYLRPPGRKTRRVFVSAYRWVVQSAGLSPQLALIAGGPDGLVLIDRLTGKRIRRRPCGGRIWVSSVAVAGERVFLGTSRGLREASLSELEALARKRARKRH